MKITVFWDLHTYVRNVIYMGHTLSRGNKIVFENMRTQGMEYIHLKTRVLYS
jgi:hypothetical protein